MTTLRDLLIDFQKETRDMVGNEWIKEEEFEDLLDDLIENINERIIG